jgi:hypothetical protein
MHRTMDTPTVVILLVVALFILLAILKKVGRVAARVSSPWPFLCETLTHAAGTSAVSPACQVSP